ncbi:sporulation protein YpjB [Microaerobacter geothermalis]|uniref:sporulation protein YpjB n=1 Tax=Microaerobacter geothermalis TaxID=674972 RepID=UPI0038B3E353
MYDQILFLIAGASSSIILVLTYVGWRKYRGEKTLFLDIKHTSKYNFCCKGSSCRSDSVTKSSVRLLTRLCLTLSSKTFITRW